MTTTKTDIFVKNMMEIATISQYNYNKKKDAARVRKMSELSVVAMSFGAITEYDGDAYKFLCGAWDLSTDERNYGRFVSVPAFNRLGDVITFANKGEYYVRSVAEKAIENGVESFLEAFAAGVPVSDILA